MEKALHLIQKDFLFPLTRSVFYYSALSCTAFGDGMSQILPVAFAEVKLE